MTNEEYMSLALDLAREAAEHGEVPVGCVIADAAGRVIGRGRNRREELGDATAHAEVEAIREAGAALGSWRLEGCTMYVTLEPCIMCAGLMHQSRVDRCVYGAADEKAGALGTLYSVHADERLNHQFEVVPGVLGEECKAQLKAFFKELRAKRKEQNRKADKQAALHEQL